jgi:hypothetical protein
VQPFIPVGVVKVPVRINEVRYRIGAETGKSLGDLGACAGETGVDEELAAATGKDSNISSCTHEHAYVATEFLDGDRGGGCSFTSLFDETGCGNLIRLGEDAARSDESDACSHTGVLQETTARNSGS